MSSETDADASVQSEYDQRWDAIALELGHIVIRWSRIEFFLARTFHGLAGASDSLSNMLVHRLAANTLEAVILDLLKAIPAVEADPIREWIKAVRTIRQWRNSILHSALADQRGDGEWHPTKVGFRINEDGQMTVAGERITIRELQDVRTALGTLAQGWVDLPERAHGGVATSGGDTPAASNGDL